MNAFCVVAARSYPVPAVASALSTLRSESERPNILLIAFRTDGIRSTKLAARNTALMAACLSCAPVIAACCPVALRLGIAVRSETIARVISSCVSKRAIRAAQLKTLSSITVRASAASTGPNRCTTDVKTRKVEVSTLSGKIISERTGDSALPVSVTCWKKFGSATLTNAFMKRPNARTRSISAASTGCACKNAFSPSVPLSFTVAASPLSVVPRSVAF